MKRCMTSTRLGETAYTLKDIEYNEGIKVSQLRADIKNGILKPGGKAYGTTYYIIQSELNKYLRVIKRRIEISENQFAEMEHALGLDRSKKPYRNRFYCSCNDYNWLDLVNKGLARKGATDEEGRCYFWLNRLGIAFILGKSISDEDYKEL